MGALLAHLERARGRRRGGALSSVARSLLLAAAIMLMVLPRATLASESDYLPDSVAWNGLSDLRDLARGRQHQLLLVEDLDWSKLRPDAVLFLIHPTRELGVQPFIDFLSGGGRLLIADDFGQAKELLMALGIQRLDGAGIRAEHYYQDKLQLPVATTSTSAHPLTRGIDSLLANHPSYFRSQLPTLAGFEEGQQLIIAGKVGKGIFVALSDPSVLINAMLRFAGNRALADNLLEYLAPVAGRPIYILTGHSGTSGEPLRQTAHDGVGAKTQRFMDEYNKFLTLLNSYAPRARLLRVLAFGGGCISFLCLFLLLPLPRKPLRGEWLRPLGADRQSLEDQVRTITSGSGGHRAHYPAAILREELEERLSERLQTPDPVFTMKPDWVIRQTRRLFGEESADLVRQLIATVRRIPLLSGGDGGQLRGLRPKELSRFYLLSLALLERIDREPALPTPSAPDETPPAGE